MLISEKYRKLNQDLHDRAVFGQRGARHAGVVRDMLREFGSGAVLDYGCGRATLALELPEIRVHCYDPAVPKFAADPPAVDYVVCTDVLEHVEPECLSGVLAHLRAKTLRLSHIVIATKLDGRKKLADGRDPHLIVQDAEWWRTKLDAHYGVVRLVNQSNRDCTFRAFP